MSLLAGRLMRISSNHLPLYNIPADFIGCRDVGGLTYYGNHKQQRLQGQMGVSLCTDNSYTTTLSSSETSAIATDGVTGRNSSVLFVDTYRLIHKLKDAGFTEQEAAGLTDILVAISSKVMSEQSSLLVSRSTHEITSQQLLSQMAGLRKDMVILEKSEFSALKNENEKLKMDMQLLRQAFREEVDRVGNTIKLDLNLEKSRAREEHNKVQAEIIKTQNRIDTTVANLRTSFEQYRNDMFKYAAGTIISCLGIFLSFYRLWK